VDPFDPAGKGAVQKQMQDKAAAEDAVGVCTFASFGATQPEALAPMYNACTGENLSVDEWMTAGDRIWNLERLFNNRAGLSRKDDSLPPRMTREPLTNGAVHNQVVHLEEMLREYYEVRGWDSDGNPSAETLARLGIG
jgi:aldehyde:ferredoxin oxidoreductase